MKGQYLTVEYVIFFAIGVAMIISTYFIFYNMNYSFEKRTTKEQLKITGEMIRGSSIKMFETSNSTNSTIYHNLTIPPKFSRCIYKITTNGGLNLNCSYDSRIGVILSLYNFNIQTENIIYSSKGFIEMVSNGKKVELK